jgi:uncharacterized PurR-regulated membrane protein YhhQ (DUF165 family)
MLGAMSHGSTLPTVQHRYAGLPELSVETLHERRERVFLVLAGLFLGALAMLNILGITRFLNLAFFIEGSGDWTYKVAIAVGVLPYPLTFLCTDFISELYGRRRANFVVWIGLGLNALVVLTLWLGTALPGFAPIDPVTGMPPQPRWDEAKSSYIETGWTLFQLKRLAFGAVAASMLAYLTAQFVDVQLFHLWKWLTKNKHLWLRNNGSTLASQLVDTVSVILVTHFYAHALPIDDRESLWPQILAFIGAGYAFKAVIALLDTLPFYAGAYWLSRYMRLPPPHEPPAPPPGAVVQAGVG